MKTCGEVLAGYLDAYGVEVVTGIPGTHTIELYRGIPATRMRHITPRHEQGAGFLADGYARVSGKPAACITVSGPGAFNIATAMGQALQDSVPMLVISADNATFEQNLGQGRLHETSHLQRAMESCSRWSHTVMRPDELPQVMARAFAIFHSERPGPVHLTLPLDVITADASHVPVEVWPLPSRPAPAPEALARALALIESCESVVIAAGGGARDAAASLRRLAEKLDAPVTVTHNAKGVLPPDHPLLVTASPSYRPVRDLYAAADLIIGVGTEFSETDYDFFFDGGFDLAGTAVLRIDLDSAQLARNVRPEVALCADAGYALEALCERVAAKNGPGVSRVAAVNKASRAMDPAGYREFLACIQEALPGAVVVGDSTQPAYFSASCYEPPEPRLFASAATGYGTLGYALPAALGAKLGRPDRAVVSLNGDGGIQFTVNELATAVEANIPVAIVIWHNHSYGQIAANFRDAGMEPIACDIFSPDFVRLAQAYGCEARRAANLKEFREALRSSSAASLPTVIEVVESDFIA